MFQKYAPSANLPINLNSNITSNKGSHIENPFVNNYLYNNDERYSEIKDDMNMNERNEETLQRFFNKELFSDCLIIDPLSKRNIRCHALLLASNSDLFFKHFQKYNEIIQNMSAKNPHKIKIPVLITSEQTTNNNNMAEIFEKCLNYFYFVNNDFEFLLQNGFSHHNCFSYYSYFYAVNHFIALKQIEDFIIRLVVNPMNVIMILLEALHFQSYPIIQKCLEIIETNFETLIQTKENYTKIRELPFDIFKNILSTNKLNINKEDIVLQIALDYINYRENEEEKLDLQSKAPPKFLEPTSQTINQNLPPPKQNLKNITNSNNNNINESNVEKISEILQKNELPPKINAENENLPEEKKIDENPKPNENENNNINTQEKTDSAPNNIQLSEIPKPSEQPKKDLAIEDGIYLLGEIPDLNILNKDLFKKFKLTPNEKYELLSCCRLSFIDHEFLLKASNFPSVAEFKDLFIEAISAKLLNYEGAKHNYTINLNPRDSYRELLESQIKRNYENNQAFYTQSERGPEKISENPNKNIKIVSSAQEKRPTLQKNENPQFQEKFSPAENQFIQKQQLIKPESQTYKPIPQNFSSNIYKQPPTQQYESSPPSGLKNQQEFSRSPQPKTIENPTKNLYKSQEVPPSYKQKDFKEKHAQTTIPENEANQKQRNFYSNTSPQQGFYHERDHISQFTETRDAASQITPKISNISNEKNYQPYYQSANIPEQEVHSHYIPGDTHENFYEGNIKQPFYRSEEIAKVKTAQSLSPIEFIYKYDFDDNGVFYYLGSRGKTKKWANPYEINIVDVVFSSIGQGVKIQDFIGRECVNCCTRNEKNAFMSVDLKEGRSLLPSCYTLKNRPSKKYVLMNWVLEASVNNNEWFILDKRIHLTEDQDFNSMLEKEREELIQKGQTSTWGIDCENIENILSEINKKSKINVKGFRYFRISQIMKNSDGEYNLCLSGLELYGTGYGTKWYF